MRNVSLAALSVALIATSGVAEARWLSVDPVQAQPNVTVTFNRYHYAANNPYKFTDPDGREIRFPKGSPADFYRNAATAIRFLNSHGLARTIGEVHMDKQVVNLVPSSDRTNAFTTHYDSGTNTLYWADKAAFIMRDAETGEWGRRSPALTLGHDFEHAAEDLANPKDLVKDFKTPDPQFTNRAEANAITEWENPAAQKLGEPIRDSHQPKAGEHSEATDCVKTSCP